MSISRSEAEAIVINWLDETVGVSVSEHVDGTDVGKLLDLLGVAHPDEHLDPKAVAQVARKTGESEPMSTDDVARLIGTTPESMKGLHKDVELTTPTLLASKGFSTGYDPEGPCPDCPHRWGGHHMYRDFKNSGRLRCPEPDCDCESTWGTAERPAV